MRQGVRDGILLVLKTISVILGAILLMAALVDLVVTGITQRGLIVLVVGLAMVGLPVAFAFRDALKHGRRRRPAPPQKPS